MAIGVTDKDSLTYTLLSGAPIAAPNNCFLIDDSFVIPPGNAALWPIFDLTLIVNPNCSKRTSNIVSLNTGVSGIAITCDFCKFTYVIRTWLIPLATSKLNLIGPVTLPRYFANPVSIDISCNSK